MGKPIQAKEDEKLEFQCLIVGQFCFPLKTRIMKRNVHTAIKANKNLGPMIQPTGTPTAANNKLSSSKE